MSRMKRGFVAPARDRIRTRLARRLPSQRAASRSGSPDHPCTPATAWGPRLGTTLRRPPPPVSRQHRPGRAGPAWREPRPGFPLPRGARRRTAPVAGRGVARWPASARRDAPTGSAPPTPSRQAPTSCPGRAPRTAGCLFGALARPSHGARAHGPGARSPPASASGPRWSVLPRRRRCHWSSRRLRAARRQPDAEAEASRRGPAAPPGAADSRTAALRLGPEGLPRPEEHPRHCAAEQLAEMPSLAAQRGCARARDDAR